MLFLIKKKYSPPLKQKYPLVIYTCKQKSPFLFHPFSYLYSSLIYSHTRPTSLRLSCLFRDDEVEFLKTNSYLVFEAKYTKAKGKKKNISAKDKKERGVDLCCNKYSLYYSAFDQSNFSYIERNSRFSFSNTPGANAFFEEEFFSKRPPKTSRPKSRFQRDSSSIACK